ncbi:SLC37A4 (predicted) [Pycnogonum litorale]
MNNLIIFCSTFFGYICYSYDRKSISYTFPSLRSKGLISKHQAELKGWKSSYEQMFLSPIIWVVSFSYMVIFFTRTCCLEWAQMYLIEELSQNQLTANFFITGFETGGIAGGFLAGWASDWARTKLKIEGNKRMVVTIVLHVVLVLLLHFFLFNVTSSTSTVVFIFIGLMLGACIYGSIAIFGVVAVETVPPELSGTSHAVASLACNLGGIIGGLPVTLIASNYSWSFVFLILEIICVLSTSIMLLTRNTDRMPIKRD